MQRIPVAEATDAQIRDYLTIAMGVEVPARASRATMLAALESVQPEGKTILVSPTAATLRPGASATLDLKELLRRGLDMTDRVLVQVEQTPEAQRDKRIFLNHNGDFCTIKPGIAVAIKLKHVIALEDAKYRAFERDENGFPVGDGYLVPRYPYRILGVVGADVEGVVA